MPLSYNVRIAVQAPVQVTVDAAQASRTLARMAAGMRNPRPVVESMAKAVRQGIKTQFAVGGNPAWKPNAPNTVAAKGSSKPLHGGRGTSGIEKATHVDVVEQGKSFTIVVRTSALGRYHNYGRGVSVHQAKWLIKPVRAAALRFFVAEGRGSFRKSRSRAQANRRAGGRSSVPGRPGPKPAFAMHVWHPGYPARRFVPVIDQAWLQRNWRGPVRRYLFEGVNP